MKGKAIAVALILLSFTGVVSAHRLDEYLQATLISVGKDRVEVSMRLIPGVAVSSAVIASIDTNGDGSLSSAEQSAYVQRVLSELSLSIDGRRLTPHLVSANFPQIQEMRDGVGEIHVEYTAELPSGGPDRRLVLENHNRAQRAVYLVNALASSDPAIRIVAQKRNTVQSAYELDYTEAGSASASGRGGWWSNTVDAMNAPGLLSLYHLGMRHIAGGTDHLLFLLVLLLPAPLGVVASRWTGVTGVRSSLLHILEIVTAFTVGHSITLGLAAFGLVHLPSRPVEVLIAVSILVSALHALRPIFPGKEAAIAAFFGLFHGLAFASTLSALGLARWERVAGILAFNLGIETMQIAVVAAILPSLLLMSRTRAYRFLRIFGAIGAGAASVGWIAERIWGVQSQVDVVVNGWMHHAVWIAVGLLLLSIVCFVLQNWMVARATPYEGSASGLSRQY
ncbi:MAG: HupE/UreJ family protein [Acidobacteriaceae bacterium]